MNHSPCSQFPWCIYGNKDFWEKIHNISVSIFITQNIAALNNLRKGAFPPPRLPPPSSTSIVDGKTNIYSFELPLWIFQFARFLPSRGHFNILRCSTLPGSRFNNVSVRERVFIYLSPNIYYPCDNAPRIPIKPQKSTSLTMLGDYQSDGCPCQHFTYLCHRESINVWHVESCALGINTDECRGYFGGP